MTDNLSERFAALEADMSRHALLVASDRVRARGDRRRIGVVATSAVVVGAFATLSTVGVNLVGGGRGNFVGNPPQGIPADLRLPHEGETGWQGGENVAIPPGTFTGCGADDPTHVGRTDRRVAFGPGWPEEQSHSPTVVTEQLMLFDSDLSAKSAMAALGADYRACGWIDPGMGRQLDAQQMSGKYPNARLERILGIQTGNAIFLLTTTTTGALMSSAGTTELPVIEARLCSTLGLCQPTQTSGASAPPPPSGSEEPVGPSSPPSTSPTGTTASTTIVFPPGLSPTR